MLKKFFTLSLKIGISALLVYLVFKFSNIDLVKTWHELKKTNINWFILSIVLIATNFFTNAYRWRVLANLLDYKLKYSRALKMYFESMFSNNFLPTNFGGDAIRAYDLGKDDKSWLKAASTILAERAFGFTMMYCLVPIGFAFYWFSSFKGLIPDEVSGILLLGFAGLILGLLTYRIWLKLPFAFVEKIKFTIDEYTRCKKSLFKVVIWTLATHFCFISAHVAATAAVGISFSALPWWYWLIMTPAATLAGFVIPSVKGVGAREASFIYFLGLFGIDSDKSLAIAFLTFLATLLATLPGISIVFRKKKAKPDEVMQ